MTSRNPEMIWEDKGRTGLAWEDLSERFSLKLHSILRYSGRFHYTLWEREVIGPDFFERTGQFAPIYSMEMQVTDEPLDMREPLVVETAIRLGRTVDAAGRATRIVSQSEQRLAGTSADGRPVEVGRIRKHSVFTRPVGSRPEVPRADSKGASDDAREARRVTSLHESLGLAPEPPRVVTLLTASDLSVPHADFDPDPDRPAVTFADDRPHVWGYEQTDPNRHVHAMDYVKVFETFGWDHLADHGIPASDHFYDGCRIVFRAPCFRGERFLRKARFEPRTARGGGGGLILGRLFKVGKDGNPADPSRPAIAIQLGVRPNLHPRAGGHDSE